MSEFVDEECKKADEEADQEDEDKYHGPSDQAFAAIKLELHHPRFPGEEKAARAWKELHAAQRSMNQAIQLAMGDVLVHFRDLRSQGKSRFPTSSERSLLKNSGIPFSCECYTDDDIKKIGKILEKALRASGLTEYVWNSARQKIQASEFSGEKLRGLLQGETAYPVLGNFGIPIRARTWKVETREFIDDKGKKKLAVMLEIWALRPGMGHMQLFCRNLHGKQMHRAKRLLQSLEKLGFAATGTVADQTEGWHKGALIVRSVKRPGLPPKWQLLLPYYAPRIEAGAGDATIAIHRGVVNMLSAVVDFRGEKKVFHYPGKTVVGMKNQMYARRRGLSQDISSKPHTSRGRRYRFKALRRLADKEARATQTELWRAARWVQGIVERYGAKTVLLDDFRAFDPDRPGPPFEPYVRNFPLADLRMKIIDAITRRVGIGIQECQSKYISQRCPECGNIDPENIERLPVVIGIHTEDGFFKCKNPSCDCKGNIDRIAALNLLTAWTAEGKESK